MPVVIAPASSKPQAIMNDGMLDSPADAHATTVQAMERALAELERRVQMLESRVAVMPDSRLIEEHVTERVRASLPPPPPPIDPTQAPSLRDITLPIPSVQTMVSTAKTTWTLFEMLAELKLLFWMLVDRRYHMAWITRIITILLLVAILLSHFWLPLSSLDKTLSPIWDKFVDLFLGVILFMFLNFEMRRYKDWRTRR